ncbi:hypothetical protein [Streptomyces cyaneus]|nr:hypothetical protein [Streptomyces cyaneus]
MGCPLLVGLQPERAPRDRQFLTPATVMRMLREHDDQTARAASA